MLSPPLAASEEWPEFRGPFADGHAGGDTPGAAKRVPVRWSETENVRWKVAVPGRGWSSPVIWGDQLWLTTATEDGRELSALCFDRDDGSTVHSRLLFEVEDPRPLGNAVNSYATPSPVIEAGRVFVSFGSYGTACLDTENGTTRWQRRDLPCNHFRGPASSPVSFEGLLILHMDGSDHQYIIALDKESGETRWRTERSTDYGDLDESGKPRADGDFRKAFNTPVVVGFEGRPMLLSAAAKAAYGYDPRTGKEIWTVRYGNHSTASRPLFDGRVAFINTGYPKAELWAVRVDGEGDVTDTHVAWTCLRNVPNRSSPLLLDGRIYMVSDRGIASCLDAASGEQLWQERLGGNFSASVLLAGGHLYFFDEEGAATVARPSGQRFERVARNQLEEGMLASPAVAGGALFVRTKGHLYRIEAAGPATGAASTPPE
jgi:outer membrane protein assembly factor BamB